MTHIRNRKNSLLTNLSLSLLMIAGVTACQEAPPQNSNTTSVPETHETARQQVLTKAVSTVAPLAARADVQAAFADLEAMNAKNITRLIEITEIPAPPFAEEVRAQDYAQRLRALGLTDVTIDDVGNVIARRKGADGE